MIRRVETDDWERLRDVRLRALASDPDAFRETVEDARTFDDDAETVHLVGMWIAPDLRGSGVAPELVERIIEWSRSHGRVRVVLSVERGNARAARLYEKCGFVEPDTPPPLPYEPRPGTRFYEYTL